MILQSYQSLVFIFRLMHKYDCDSNLPDGESSNELYVLEEDSGGPCIKCFSFGDTASLKEMQNCQ